MTFENDEKKGHLEMTGHFFYYYFNFLLCMKRADLIVIGLPVLSVTPETQGGVPGY